MKQKEIRCPKASAVIFLLMAFAYIFSSLGSVLTAHFANPGETQLITTISHAIFAVSHLFISIVLFSKRYDKILIVAISSLAIAYLVFIIGFKAPINIFSLVIKLILVFIAYCLISDKSEKLKTIATKIRYIVPVGELIFLIFSAIRTIISVNSALTKNLAASGGPESNVLVFSTVFTSVFTVLAGILPVINYFILVNWLAKPYENDI